MVLSQKRLLYDTIKMTSQTKSKSLYDELINSAIPYTKQKEPINYDQQD